MVRGGSSTRATRALQRKHTCHGGETRAARSGGDSTHAARVSRDSAAVPDLVTSSICSPSPWASVRERSHSNGADGRISTEHVNISSKTDACSAETRTPGSWKQPPVTTRDRLECNRDKHEDNHVSDVPEIGEILVDLVGWVIILGKW